MTAMPWAEPPGQPAPFDTRDAEEAREFDRHLAGRPALTHSERLALAKAKDLVSRRQASGVHIVRVLVATIERLARTEAGQ